MLLKAVIQMYSMKALKKKFTVRHSICQPFLFASLEILSFLCQPFSQFDKVQ